MSSAARHALLACKLLVSGALLFVLYRQAPLDAIIALLMQANWLLMALIMLFLLGNTVLSAVKWRLFLKADGIEVPLQSLVVTYLIGSFFNVFLPSNIGGDSYRMLYTAQKSQQATRSVVAVIADRATGFLALVSLSLMASPLAAARLQAPALVLAPLCILIALSAALWALYQREPLRRPGPTVWIDDS